jgi:pyrimidine-nucleoside phosphorylase
MQPLSTPELLNRKRRGEEIAAPDLARFIAEYTLGEIPDYQMAAFLMAVAIRGMSAEETATLTRAMLLSGERWDLRRKYDFVVDKHSTGGVGDKISLILAPWLAACGVKVAMLSGQGLGHTGGTLDKLESIPRFNARLSREQIERCLDEVGCVIATSTDQIAPADRKIYALRDVTGTVESLPLITASIMSKKLALGASALILDVKAGSGAFMRTIEEARALAESLIAAADGSGTRVEAMITDMDQPLGVAIGNVNEVIESMEVLQGKGPRDIHDLTRAQAIRAMVLSGADNELSAGAKLDAAITSGAAIAKAREWIAAQGADPSFIDQPSVFPQPKQVLEIRSDRSGFLNRVDAYAIGLLAVDIGSGRRRREDSIDPTAGLMFDRNVGDEIRAGDLIGRIQLGERRFDGADLRERFLAAVSISAIVPTPRILVHEVIAPKSVP